MTAAARKGDWICTFTGKAFWPLDPRVDDVDVQDVAHALSCLCRFNGHVRVFYSVAQHSVECAELAMAFNRRPAVQLRALLHDAAEAYLADVPRPVKGYLPGYRELEREVDRVAWRGLCPSRLALAITDEEEALVRSIDDAVLSTERRDLMPPTGRPWKDLPPPLPHRIVPMLSVSAERAFLALYADICDDPAMNAEPRLP